MTNENENASCDNKQPAEKSLCPDDWEPDKKSPHTLPPDSATSSPRRHADKRKSLTYEEIVQQLEERIQV